MSREQVTLYRDQEDRFGVVHGDALQLLERLPTACVDAIVTDPPYGIGFAKAAWDRPTMNQANGAEGFAAWTAAWASAARRVLKPGGPLVAFGAPRTFHRLAVGVEDAGFDLRDTVMWLCGQGVPKGRRLPGGFSTTLRPGYEPILLARSPLTRIAGEMRVQPTTGLLRVGYSGTRWPQNVVLTHTARCRPERCAPKCPTRLLDRVHPEQRPSRFFYAPKASRREREAGCEHLPASTRQLFGSKRQGGAPRHNTHPTVKPLGLMRWLVQLICPEGGIVLDPFAGSGSTGIAAVLECRGFVGIERDPEYLEIACARLAHWSEPR